MPGKNKNYFLVPIAVLCLSFTGLNGQTLERNRLDSLLKQLQQEHTETSRVQLLNSISYFYFSINPDSGIIIANQALRIANAAHDSGGIAGAYRSLGANYWEKNNYLQSQDFYWASLRITQKINDDFGTAKSLHGIATNYETEYNFQKALEYYRQSAQVAQKICDTVLWAGCLSNIAEIYNHDKMQDSALYCLGKARSLFLQEHNSRDAAFMERGIALIYADQGKYRQALALQQRVLKVFEELNLASAVGILQSDIAAGFNAQSQYNEALRYYFASLATYNKIKDNYFSRFKARTYLTIGNVYVSMSADKSFNRSFCLNQATVWVNKGIQLCKQLKEPAGLRDAYKVLAPVMAAQGNYKAAYESYNSYVLYKDSLNNVELDKKAARTELENIYTKKKDSLSYLAKLNAAEMHKLSQEAELAQFKLREQWLYFTIAAVIACFAASLFIYRYQTRRLQFKNQLDIQKREKQLMEIGMQQKLDNLKFAALRSQMNPHFIFNALNTVQSYVYMNDKKSAGNYLGKFSELMRKILDNSNKQTITLAEEIRLLHLYIDIEQARFGDNLSVAFFVDPTLDTGNLQMMPMIIQPYVENAIKHGLMHKNGAKNLSVNIMKIGQCIEIVVDDNGVGRTQSAAINKARGAGHNSFAHTAGEERIELLQKLFGKEAGITIIDKKNIDDTPAGTKVVILVPQL